MPCEFDLVARLGSRLSDEITTLVSKAGAAILEIDSSAVAKRIKPDLSPVTAADDAAQAVILQGLSELLPGIPIISEEMSGQRQISELGSAFVLVDPLDGTREYLAGRGEFTVNIALLSQGMPVFGCIAAPALGLIWRGVVGHGAERLELPAGANASQCVGKTSIRTRQMPEREPAIAVSRSHFDPQTERFLAQFPHAKRVGAGLP